MECFWTMLRWCLESNCRKNIKRLWCPRRFASYGGYRWFKFDFVTFFGKHHEQNGCWGPLSLPRMRSLHVEMWVAASWKTEKFHFGFLTYAGWCNWHDLVHHQYQKLKPYALTRNPVMRMGQTEQAVIPRGSPTVVLIACESHMPNILKTMDFWVSRYSQIFWG